MNNEIATKTDLINLSKDISRTILENNLVLVDMMDKKIKDSIKENNEYIFSEFNDQTERILSLFKGVIRVKKDGTFSVNF